MAPTLVSSKRSWGKKAYSFGYSEKMNFFINTNKFSQLDYDIREHQKHQYYLLQHSIQNIEEYAYLSMVILLFCHAYLSVIANYMLILCDSNHR